MGLGIAPLKLKMMLESNEPSEIQYVSREIGRRPCFHQVLHGFTSREIGRRTCFR